MFILYTLVICIDSVVYNTLKEHFVGNFFIIEILGKLEEQAPVFSHFSHFLSLFLTGQTPSKDDFSEDEWQKLLPP